MQVALMKAIQYLVVGIIILVILKFAGDMNITPYSIAVAIITIAIFFIYFFKEKNKNK